MRPRLTDDVLLSTLLVAAIGCGGAHSASAEPPASARLDRSSSSPTRCTVFFFCPDDNPGRRQLAKKAFFTAVEGAEAHTRWHVFTGRRHDHLITFDIPAATGRRRFRELRGVIATVHKGFDSVPLDADAQVNLPALSATVRAQLTTETSCQVAIYGSPRYLNPDQNAFEHNGVFVTKDGSVGHKLSPFQVSPRLPADTRVVWVTPINQFGYDERHMAAIRHFNGYYLQEVGGVLLRTTEDIGLLFDFEKPRLLETYVKKDPSPGKYAATVKTVSNGDEEIATVEFESNSISAPGCGVEESPESVLASAEQDKGTIALAINWYSTDPSCDIDMRLSSNGLPGELSYGTPVTTWGRHFRDVTSASSEQARVEDYQNWEWIRVDHARLHDLVLYLNVFRTTAPARVTVVRVWNGERKVRVIDLNVTKGDQAAYRNNRRASEAWRRVSLYSITDTDQLGN